MIKIYICLLVNFLFRSYIWIFDSPNEDVVLRGIRLFSLFECVGRGNRKQRPIMTDNIQEHNINNKVFIDNALDFCNTDQWKEEHMKWSNNTI